MATATARADLITRGNAEEVYDYTVKARTPDGKTVTRRAKAARKADVYKAVSESGLTVLGISGGPAAGVAEIKIRKRAKHRPLVTTTASLATMFEAGLNPLEAFEVAIDDCEDLVLRDAMVEVREQIRNGTPIAEAMGNQPAFPPTLVNFIAAGEASGSLKQAFRRVAEQYDAEDKLRAKVKKAAFYPIILAIFSIAIFAFMMLYLVPQFAATFTEVGGPDAKLPLLTRIVIKVSDTMVWVLPVFLGLLAAVLVYWRINMDKPEFREWIDPKKLKIPIFGRLFRAIAIARLARNLSGLLAAGVDRLEALDITARTVGNTVFGEVVTKAREAQQMGQPLVGPMREAVPLIPTLLVKMIDVGERTGSTPETLANCATIFERDIDRITDNLAALIEPIFLAVLGGFAGVIVLAIYLPYLSFGNLI